MSAHSRTYRSYLIRLWQEKGDGDERWRVSLQNVRTRETIRFAGLHDLFDYLLRQTSAPGIEDSEERPDAPATR